MRINWDPRALEILDRLRNAGFQAVLVGGCVRDSLLGRPLHDYDAATSARPEQVLELCQGFHCLETGLKHGTVTIINRHLPVEVTTFRSESGYSDHRRPDHVAFTDSLLEDLSRRDYTINAIAWDDGAPKDPFGGEADLQARLVRCVGDPDRRFEEDALRPLRGLRLAAQLDFELEEETARAIRRHIPDLAHVSWERIAAEFIRLICSPGAVRILLDWPDAVSAIIPELAPVIGFGQTADPQRPDLYAHTIRTLEGVPPEPPLRLAALLHDAGKPRVFREDAPEQERFRGHEEESASLAKQALRRLRLPNVLQERATLLVSLHHLPLEASPRWARHWLSRLGSEALQHLLVLKRADLLAGAADARELRILDETEAAVRDCIREQPCLNIRSLAVNGRDAMAAGLSGPSIGKALQSLLDAVLDGELPNEREALLHRLDEIATPDST